MADTTKQPGQVIAFPGGMSADYAAKRDAVATVADAPGQQQFVPVGVLDDPPDEDGKRSLRMKRAWSAYTGEFMDPLPKNRTNGRQPNANVKENRCEPIVKTGVDFLVGKDLTLQVEADEEGDTSPDDEGELKTGSSDAQDFLDAFAEHNQLMTLLAKAATNGGVFGHVFLKLVPVKDTQTPPRLLVLDSQAVRVEADPDDCTTALAYIVQYRSSIRVRDAMGRMTTKPVDKRQVIERVFDPALGEGPLDAQCWRITDQQRDAAASYLSPGTFANQGISAAWGTVAQTEWDYAWPPIFDCQNLPAANEYWGVEDITPDLIEANEVINRVQSNVAKILDWWASPKLWAKGVSKDTIIDADPSKVTVLGPEGELNIVQPVSDVSASLNFLGMLRSNMDAQSRTPAVAVGRISELPKGNLSGVALELLYQPPIQKMESKRRLAGEMLERIGSCVLEYAGYGKGLFVRVVWPQVLPHDPAADWQVATVKNEMGVSKATLLRENGYDPDDELQRSQQEKQDAASLQQTLFSRGQGLPSFPPTSRGVPGQTPPQLAPYQAPSNNAPDDSEEGAA